MKRSILLLLLASICLGSFAQDSTAKKNNIAYTKRPNDHFMIQFGSTSLNGRPDSVRTTGFSRHFNMYFMLNRPFKTSPNMSVAFGAGISSQNIFLKNTNVDLKSTATRLPFTNVDSANHFKKYKVTTIYGEIPVELRWVANAENPDNSFKAALGAKIGTLLKAYTKGKDYVNKAGTSLYDSKYIMKEQSKRFFNGTRLAVTGRVGFGHFSLTGEYQVTTYLKDGAGAEMRAFNLGLTISGL